MHDELLFYQLEATSAGTSSQCQFGLDSLTCACGGCLQCMGEDDSERLDIVPAQFCVIVTRQPKYACRSCTDRVAQAAAPARLIPGGLPTEATVAHVLVSKYADPLPLYQQAKIYIRQSVDLDRSMLADWVGHAAFELRPVHDALMADLKRSTKFFIDDTRAPVLAQGARKTKSGYFGALVRDDQTWGGTSPPGVVFTLAPGRGGQHAERILQGFGGILQVDGYAGYNRLIAEDRIDMNRPGFTGGQNSRRIARYGTDIKEEDLEALFTRVPRTRSEAGDGTPR